MGIEKLIPWAVGIVMVVGLTGNLHRFTQAILKAEVKLVQESKASKWGPPLLLKARRQ